MRSYERNYFELLLFTVTVFNIHPVVGDHNTKETFPNNTSICNSNCTNESVEVSNSTCQRGMFQCKNGKCIPEIQTCNLSDDCGDESDEDKTLCNGKLVCVNYDPVENGYITRYYDTFYDKFKIPSILYTFYVRCKENFGLFPVRPAVYCRNNTWSAEFPKCLPACPSRISELAELTCEKNGTTLNCDEPVAEGASISMKCKPRYEDDNPLNRPAVDCDTVCGKPAPEGTPYVINGLTANTAEFPWHIAIYKKTLKDNKYTYLYQCGGSIINPKLVLTAAHCFTDDNGDANILYIEKKFYIAGGKLHRDYETPLDIYAQKSQVETVLKHKNYRGFLTSHTADIAIAIVKQPFEFTNVVRPICIDWNNYFEDEQLKSMSIGRVAGWGFTTEDKNLSNVLKNLNMRYIEREACLKSVPEYFSRFITQDKLCAGDKTGSNVCKGDSGGGLVFYRPEDKKYYIRGLVSVGPTSITGGCSSHDYVTFTRISHYLEFIKHTLEEYSGKCKRLYNKAANDTTSTIASCTNGTWDAPLIHCVPECGEMVSQSSLVYLTNSPIKTNKFPWHVGIYSKVPSRFSFKYLCGGSLISLTTILTDTTSIHYPGSSFLRTNGIYVAAGKYYKNFDSPFDILAQTRKVIHFENTGNLRYGYDFGRQGKKRAFIVVVIVEQPFVINNFIRPVCLDWDNTFDEKPATMGMSELLQSNTVLTELFPYVANFLADAMYSKIVGWNYLAEELKYLQDLQKVFTEKLPTELRNITDEINHYTVTYLQYNECLERIGFDDLFIEDHMCTIYSHEDRYQSVRHISSGSGLVTYDNDTKKYFLRGIVAQSASGYMKYTSIKKFIDFIKQVELEYGVQ